MNVHAHDDHDGFVGLANGCTPANMFKISLLVQEYVPFPVGGREEGGGGQGRGGLYILASAMSRAPCVRCLAAPVGGN